MGYDVTQFVTTDIDKDLTCAICMGVLQNPVETPCEHHFCRECLLQWLHTQSRCPLDKAHVSGQQLCQPSRLLTNQLARLEIRCDFQAQGCTQSVKLEQLAEHRRTCSHNPRPEWRRPQTDHSHQLPRRGQLAEPEPEPDLSMAAGIGLVAVAGIIGTVVAGIMGYQRGRARD